MKKYLYCLLSCYGIHKSEKETGILIQTRHKLLTSFSEVSLKEFGGIAESDDMLFQHSEKGNHNLNRPDRKRNTKAAKAGNSDEQTVVTATCDRSGNKDFKAVVKERINKKDIAKVLDGKVG